MGFSCKHEIINLASPALSMSSSTNEAYSGIEEVTSLYSVITLFYLGLIALMSLYGCCEVSFLDSTQFCTIEEV